MDGMRSEWMDRQMDDQIDGLRNDGLKAEWIDGLMDGMNGWTGG